MFAALTLVAPAAERKVPVSLHELSATTLEGKAQPLSAYRGQVLLVVNVASECGFTPQYEGLQKLHDRFQGRGFSVLAFPCNQFGAQEPGSAQEIRTFCSTRFHVTFPLFEKVEVKGPGKSPVYAFLTAPHGEPKWNFHKYLVGKDGRVIQAFPSQVGPEAPELVKAIEAALALP
jgi:glutathione peroxidase